MNAELPPEQRVALDDPRGAVPYEGFVANAIGEAAIAAIGAYITPPANEVVVRRRRQGLMSLERYFTWCRAMWLVAIRLDELRQADGYKHDVEKEPAHEDRGEHILGCLLHWLASLDVVVEGWEELELIDATVTDTLARGGDVKTPGTFRHRLRRLRNGVFHYQREGGDDPRFREFFDTETAAGEWAVSLERVFGEFFRKTFDVQHENVFEWFHRNLPEKQWER